MDSKTRERRMRIEQMFITVQNEKVSVRWRDSPIAGGSSSYKMHRTNK